MSHHKHRFIQIADYPVYDGDDLGCKYSPSLTSFRLWAPSAQHAELLLYHNGETDYPFKIVQMGKDIDGTWISRLKGDWKGTFYTFKVSIDYQWSHEVLDPYTIACGVNGKRGIIIDLKDTHPVDWDKDQSPPFSKDNNPLDAIIYELHVRDATIDKDSGVVHKGKFIGLAETGTINKEGHTTGMDHIKSLGVTHVHLLPIFDFNTVDEHPHLKTQYNWGYDPMHYNIPEGSYSTNPFDGITRIKDLKKLIQSFHQNGLRVVMDVVYNHTVFAEKSNFHQLVPGYYYRHHNNGEFSDASSCGNETASERPMMRKFMIDSLVYWLSEFHIDGFRFDLMGIHDIETMNLIAAKLRELKPDVLLYGEGWAGGSSPLPEFLRAIKNNVSKLDNIAVFNDETRDAIKGGVFDSGEKGFISGNAHKTMLIKSGIVASCQHHQVHHMHFATRPSQVITYCECHDNYTLWDKLSLCNPDAEEKNREQMHLLALAILLTSQGIPFLHAGTEFFRSKNFTENSYKSPDSINAIQWSKKSLHWDAVAQVQELIEIRKKHPAFRLRTAEDIQNCIAFDEDAPEGTIVY
ncbi:MAG: type I pullulanase, partial [Ferruginibacter sp.]|nr:type I pullulanase [Ferruginibacter sp.]